MKQVSVSLPLEHYACLRAVAHVLEVKPGTVAALLVMRELDKLSVIRGLDEARRNQ